MGSRSAAELRETNLERGRRTFRHFRIFP